MTQSHRRGREFGEDLAVHDRMKDVVRTRAERIEVKRLMMG